MVNDMFLLYNANVLAGSGSLPAKSHGIGDIGAVGEVHPLEAFWWKFWGKTIDSQSIAILAYRGRIV